MNNLGIGLLVAVFLIVLIGLLLYFYFIVYKKKNFSEYTHILPICDETRSRGSSRLPSAKVPDQNLEFYRNNIPSRPKGESIEHMLNWWHGNYDLLETKHDYIQWLFPIRTVGVNAEATTLTDKEAKTIRDTPLLKNRVKKAFEMMLDFYGMRLDCKNNNFHLASNHIARLQELNQWGNHNFLRISRILLSLKELGHSNLMLPWMIFLAELIYQSGYLSHAQKSFEQYWIATLDAEDKLKLNQYLKNL